jgi:hypothetical protein
MQGNYTRSREILKGAVVRGVHFCGISIDHISVHDDLQSGAINSFTNCVENVTLLCSVICVNLQRIIRLALCLHTDARTMSHNAAGNRFQKHI